MRTWREFAGVGKGCLFFLVVVLAFWGGIYLAINWMVTRAVQANLLLINTRAAEFDAKAKTTAELQRLMQDVIDEFKYTRDQVKVHEHKLRNMEPVSRGITRSRPMIVTAFTCGPESTGKSPGHPAYCLSASGHRLTQADAWKAVAADPAHYKFGQRLYIEGVGDVVVRDTGGDIKGPNRLDLFVGETDVRAALNWGRRMKEVGLR